MQRFMPVGVYPPPPLSIGIIVVALKFEVIYGAQSLAGKILMSKSLRAEISMTKARGGGGAVSTHRLGLEHDCAISMVGTRLDVTVDLMKTGAANW
jgi:hypothetical protein